MRSSLRRQLLHLATDLSALVDNPDDLEHGFDLLTRSYATPVADAARAALRRDPAIAALIQQRYWGSWPNQAELLALPPLSLGHAYASWFADAGGQPLPDPVLQDAAMATRPGCTSGCATPTTSGMWCAAARPPRPVRRP